MTDKPKVGEVIPFGKHKGTPIDVLKETDPKYLDWLSQQDWFREKYANFYQVIINQGGELSETPEHNALQLKFLDKDFKRAAWMLVADAETVPEQIHPSFEFHGIDVLLAADDEHAIIELKPLLGDDYPAAVRQIRGYKDIVKRHHGDPYPSLGIVVGLFDSKVASLDQLRKLFPDVRFLTVEEVDDYKRFVPDGIQRRKVWRCFERLTKLEHFKKVVDKNPNSYSWSFFSSYADLAGEDYACIKDAMLTMPEEPRWSMEERQQQKHHEWKRDARATLERLVAEQRVLADAAHKRELATLSEIELR